MYKIFRPIDLLLRKIHPTFAFAIRRGYVKLLYKPARQCLGRLAAYGFPITKNDRKLLELKGSLRGRRVFIVGNGPSLHVSDLEKLKNEVSFGTNKIYLSFEQTTWRPTFYCSEDPLMMQKAGFLSDVLPEEMVKLLPAKPSIDGVFSNGVTFVQSKERFFEKKRPPKFSNDALAGLHWGSTVTYTCIQLACFMGASEIYLLGVDCDYTVSPGQERGDNIYVSKGENLNHFHPDYDKPGEKYFPPNLDRHLLAFQAVVNFAKSSGVKVFNATRGGKLELFTRLSLDDVISSDAKGSTYS